MYLWYLVLLMFSFNDSAFPTFVNRARIILCLVATQIRNAQMEPASAHVTRFEETNELQTRF
jgi:hypothetical protein